MEIGEMVKVAMATPFTKEDCPFCKPEEKVSEKNTLRSNYDEDTESDNDTDNNSGVLASNLKDRPQSVKGKLPEIESGSLIFQTRAFLL